MGNKALFKGIIEGYNTSGLPFTLGLTDGLAKKCIAEGTDFLYADHSYFNRGWQAGHFRLVRGHVHLRHIVKGRPVERLKKYGVQIKPWRKGGRSVVVIAPSAYIKSTLGQEDWQDRTIRYLNKSTDRPVKVRQKGDRGKLVQWLEEQDAYCVICCSSVAGVEAALAGFPVFASPHCPSYPVSAGEIQNLEAPVYPEREEWAISLAWASWHVTELPGIEFKDYNYALRAQCES